LSTIDEKIDGLTTENRFGVADLAASNQSLGRFHNLVAVMDSKGMADENSWYRNSFVSMRRMYLRQSYEITTDLSSFKSGSPAERTSALSKNLSTKLLQIYH